MMDKVRQAVFNSVLSRAGSVNVVPPGSRWLDLFAGTGSVGLEALSRGAAETHFVEMDPWVVKKVLGKNIDACGFRSRSLTHTSKAEEFLRRARELPRFAGGAFDFISMCPPYLLVSYPELFQLLEGSPLIHPGTILFVEYAKQLSDQVPLTVGPLQRVRNRAYGRTWIAVYAAAEEEEADEDEMGEVSSLLQG
jgi:16S rRNA (guanine(966)-N(2))-methyltransferase RsmD